MTTLYRKYRPQAFRDVVGQKHVVTTLENSLKQGRVGQAYLFTGPRGTGKTTLARIFAKSVNCLDRKSKNAEACGKCAHCVLIAEGRSMDVIEIDAASHTGVDNIRELRETIALPPAIGSHKIYIIDEVHMLSTGAFNALLKTLEEPPSHALFILATTALHKVPDTIQSRCQRFDLGRFPVEKIIEKLAAIAKAEKLSIEPGALKAIALAAEGGMRDAESLLTQIATLDAKKITEEAVIELLGTAKQEAYSQLLRALQEDRLADALTQARGLAREGRDFSVFLAGFIHSLRDLLLFTALPEPPLELISHLTQEDQEVLRSFATRFSPETVVGCLEILQEAQRDSRNALIPELPLEIALVKMSGLIENPNQSQESRIRNQERDTKTAKDIPVAHPPTSAYHPPTEDSGKGLAKTATEAKNQEQGIKNQGMGSEADCQPVTSDQFTNNQLPVDQLTGNLASETSDPDEGSPSTLAATIEFGQILEHWPRILATARHLNASLSLGLSTATPKTIEGNTVVIAVKYPFHKERLDEPANQLTLSEAFATILGAKLRSRVLLDEAPTEKSSDALSGNPLINQAMSLLGGRIAEGA